MKLFNIFLFIISFLFGILCIYLDILDKNIVYVYPTNDNISSLQYKDKADVCYNINSDKIACQNNMEKIKILV